MNRILILFLFFGFLAANDAPLWNEAIPEQTIDEDCGMYICDDYTIPGLNIMDYVLDPDSGPDPLEITATSESPFATFSIETNDDGIFLILESLTQHYNNDQEGPIIVTLTAYDGEDYSEGYMESGDIPTFKIYDYSEGNFYNAIASNNIPWENNEIFNIQICFFKF